MGTPEDLWANYENTLPQITPYLSGLLSFTSTSTPTATASTPICPGPYCSKYAGPSSKPYFDYRGNPLPGADPYTVGGSTGYNIPQNVYPSSSSSSSSESTDAINWSSPLGATLLPMIQEGAAALPGLADSLSGTIQGQYNSLMRQSLQPQAFQGVLNQLASSGVLSSSAAENALAGTASQIAQDIANQGYMSQLQGVAAQMKVPGMLGQLAELARVAETQTTSQQEYSDPLAPYTLMAQLLMSA